MLHKLKRIFAHRGSLISYIGFLLLFLGIWYTYSDIDYVAANYRSYTYAYTDMVLSWYGALIFPLLIASIIYKSMAYGKRVQKKPIGFLGIISGIISVCITGASCCGITLISVLGLSSMISFLEIWPYHGLEIKLLGLIMLSYATYRTVLDIDNCQIKK